MAFKPASVRSRGLYTYFARSLRQRETLPQRSKGLGTVTVLRAPKELPAARPLRHCYGGEFRDQIGVGGGSRGTHT